MTRAQRNQAIKRPSRIQRQARRAVVVHDGSAFELAADLRRYGFDVAEGPLLSSSSEVRGAEGSLAVIATRPGAARSGRLREWTHQLCWRGSPVLAVGGAIVPVAEFFGSRPGVSSEPVVSGRLSDICSAGEGLFAGMPPELRLALPSGGRFGHTELSAEFKVTAWTKDGELIAASHVFRPVHLLHSAALESRETRPVVLENLLRLLRERGGRAF
jgi:anthranilate/para-aminobenzoate synthase component II